MAAIWIGAAPRRQDHMDFTADLVRILLPHVAVRVLVETEEAVVETTDGLRRRGVDPEPLSFIVDRGAGFSVREHVQFTVDADRGAGVLAFRWNTYGIADWCERYLYPDDPERAGRAADDYSEDDGQVARRIAALLGVPVSASEVVMEGGGIDVNGAGLLLVSEPLALQRNRRRTKAELDVELRELPGVTKVIWLGEGLAEDPHMKATITGDYIGLGTGGHVDEFARFADPSTVLLAWVDDEDVAKHPLNALNRKRMEANFDILTRSTDQNGQPLRVIKVPLPTVIERQEMILERSDDELEFAINGFPTRGAATCG